MEEEVEIYLAGGPGDICRNWHATPDSYQVKIERLNGYEHYEPNGNRRFVDGKEVPVFHWTYRTAFAE
ncbi:DUF5988 family protein [Streptomyces sp. NPDC055109]